MRLFYLPGFLLNKYLIMRYDKNQATGVKNKTTITMRGWMWFWNTKATKLIRDINIAVINQYRKALLKCIIGDALKKIFSLIEIINRIEQNQKEFDDIAS